MKTKTTLNIEKRADILFDILNNELRPDIARVTIRDFLGRVFHDTKTLVKESIEDGLPTELVDGENHALHLVPVKYIDVSTVIQIIDDLTTSMLIDTKEEPYKDVNTKEEL